MVKNIRRYKKEVEKLDLLDGNTNPNRKHVLDYIPVTYSLPSDYGLFAEEYKKQPNSLWIMKPSNRAQGKGIVIITKLNQLKRWARERWSSNGQVNRDQYIISKYIHNPLLIGGRKFDLRMYCLITSFRPLRAYMYREGFARFCATRYSMDMKDVDNMFVHLTNVAIQKYGVTFQVVIASCGGDSNLTNCFSMGRKNITTSTEER